MTVTVDLATAADEPGIRALLDRLPLAGAMRLSFPREPDRSIAAKATSVRHHTVVARDAGGSVIGVGSRHVVPVWADGAPALVGYLAELRVDPRIRGRRRLLAAGFACLEATRQADELPFDLTSVVADNTSALRLLGRGVRGLPTYRPVADLTTLALAPRAARRRPPAEVAIQAAAVDDLGAVAACLERARRTRGISARVDEATLRSPSRCPDLEPGDILLARRGREVVGCAALWDQRRFKQTVVAGYAPFLALVRPLLASASRLLGGPPLPPPGSPLALASVFALAVDAADPEVAGWLLTTVLDQAHQRGLAAVLLTLDAGHPAGHPGLSPSAPRALARALGAARRYPSRLFAVAREPGALATASALAGRGVVLEVAWL